MSLASRMHHGSGRFLRPLAFAPVLLAGPVPLYAADAPADPFDRARHLFTRIDVLEWLIVHGPRLLVIVIGMYLLRWVARLFGRRIVGLLAASGAHGQAGEREARANTL